MATPTIVSPDAANRDELQRFAGRLEGLGETPRLIGPGGESIELPVAIYEVLTAVADDLRRGYSVTIMSLGAVLTTAQAAELLNVSRPHVVKLIDEGQIPHHMAGSHRRVALADLLRYKERRDQARDEALAKMHQIADEAGMDL
jgi:excisionase family DNA binding protein